MDIDPLADSVPPRHAIESDEEEDELNPLRPKSTSDDIESDIKVVGNLPSGRSLVIASGEPAKQWASGANLGEQSGTVGVDGAQIGLIFCPTWTTAVILVSEAMSRLPLRTMNKYAQIIMDTLKPSNVCLLDSYPVLTYIAAEPASPYDAPLRYLATSNVDQYIESKTKPFAPPNLIQSTSAAFMSILAATQSNGILLLLPSMQVSHPPPKSISQLNYSPVSDDDIKWSRETMSFAHELIFRAIGQKPNSTWEGPDEKRSPSVTRSRSEVGEGGMYI